MVPVVVFVVGDLEQEMKEKKKEEQVYSQPAHRHGGAGVPPFVRDMVQQTG